MRNIVIVMLMVIVSVGAVTAKTVSEMFISMPDSMLPYMKVGQRTELIGMKQIMPDSAATYPTALGGVTMRCLMDNLLTIELSSAVSLEIGRLADDRYIVVKTYGCPERESVIFTCDSLWQERKYLDFTKEEFFTDSATVEQRKLVEFPLVEGHIVVPASAGERVSKVELRVNAPLLSAEERKELEKVVAVRVIRL